MAYPPLYTDEGVDGAVVRGLQKLGWDVVRAIEVHPIGTSDEVHFKSAAEMGRLLVSNDQDMLKIAARWLRDSMEFPGLIFWLPGKYQRVGEILRAFAATSDQAEINPGRSWVKFL